MRFGAARAERGIMAAKIAALTLLLSLPPFEWISDIRRSLTLLIGLTHFGTAPVIYSLLLLLSFAGLILTPFLRSTPIRSILLAVFLSAYAFDHVVASLSGSKANGTLVRVLWQSRALAGGAFRAYRTVIVQDVAVVAALATVLVWPLRRGLRNTYALLPIASLILVPLHYRSYEGWVEGYPSTVAIPARLFLTLSEPMAHGDLPFKAVPGGLVAPSVFRKIVFIMDESVRGDYLTINDPTIDTTPFLAMAGDRVINFGLAIAGSNCSFQSRWMIRRGVREWQLPEQRAPSTQVARGFVDGPRTTMWQFAKAAGFDTVYIDAWESYDGAFHSGLTPEELTGVDRRVTVDHGARYDRDAEAARILVSVLKTSDRAFIYVDKLGAHFPYDEYSPPTFNRFTRNDGTRFKYSAKDRDENVGSYKNVVAWSVDEFFRTLLEHVDLTETLILYTSDHGQNLGDGGYAWGHCSSTNVHPSEVWVPLFAVSGNRDFARVMSKSAADSFNQATHFEIFPTLLVAMGYDSRWVAEVYGPGLLAIPAGGRRRFVIGDVIGRGWRTWVDVAKTSMPTP
jgi:hypothetical protein